MTEREKERKKKRSADGERKVCNRGEEIKVRKREVKKKSKGIRKYRSTSMNDFCVCVTRAGQKKEREDLDFPSDRREKTWVRWGWSWQSTSRLFFCFIFWSLFGGCVLRTTKTSPSIWRGTMGFFFVPQFPRVAGHFSWKTSQSKEGKKPKTRSSTISTFLCRPSSTLEAPHKTCNFNQWIKIGSRNFLPVCGECDGLCY